MSGFLEKRCFTDLVATSLSGQQICCGGVHNRVCTSAGGGVACKVHADAGTCLDQQHSLSIYIYMCAYMHVYMCVFLYVYI